MMGGNMDAITLIIGALVTARITRLVTRDVITHPLRRRLILAWGTDSKLSYLITCDWCTSVYVAAAVAAGGAGGGWWSWWWVAPLSFVFSYVAGWLASREGE